MLALGEQVRDFLYAPELAAAFVALLRSPTSPGRSTWPPATRWRCVSSSTRWPPRPGRPDLVRLGARPSPPEPARLAADVTRLRDEVGWTPSLSLQEAAARTVAWWQEQPR